MREKRNNKKKKTHTTTHVNKYYLNRQQPKEKPTVHDRGTKQMYTQ